jgi:hypothetical protein
MVPTSYEITTWLSEASPETIVRVLQLGERAFHAVESELLIALPAKFEREHERLVQTCIRIDDRIKSVLGDDVAANKGKAGEEFAESQLIEFFPRAAIEIVSADAQRADMRFKMDELAVMVEVKNVARVSAIDVEKFERDVRLSANTNCALFISLRDAPVQGIGEFGAVFIDNTPVVYVCGVIANPATLRCAVRMLAFMVAQHKNSADNDKIIELVDRVYGRVRADANRLIQMKRQLFTLGALCNEAEASALASEMEIEALWGDTSNVVVRGGTSSEADAHIEAAVANCARLYAENNNIWPSAKELYDSGVKVEDVKNGGGFRAILRDAKISIGYTAPKKPTVAKK